MVQRSRWVLASALVLAGLLVGAGPAAAADITITDGETAAVFDYASAIRERVYIPVPGVDQDGDGVTDEVAIEIMRPQESGPALKVPAIVDPSPYYTTLCRGNEGECISDTNGDGVNDKWPLFVDNFFVPRGYAVILAEADGTGNSKGCPMHGGPGDIAGMKAVVDWLNGRTPGEDGAGNPVVADWHNGKAAMIGKSYDGTLTNGVAATGVAGLTTIVPESAISDWYGYSRMGGIRFNTDYPATLSKLVTNPARQSLCQPVFDAMKGLDGDETGDRNPFWDQRDYVANVANVHAAVFATHGLQDDNVRMDQFSQWWEGLAANGVPRKLWLLREGHVDPFDSRRADWVDTLHRWFDYWLMGVQNGIMGELRVDIEDSADVWHTYTDWPLPGTADTDVYLRGRTPGAVGDARLASGGSVDTLSWMDAPSQTESTMLRNPTLSQANRRVFLSRPLTQDLRISGAPVVHLDASLSTPQSNLGALLVDYADSSFPEVDRLEGVNTGTAIDCWGPSDTTNGDYDSCYRQVTKDVTNVTQWRVTSGILDSSNRTSLTTATPVTPGELTHFDWPLVPSDYTFAAGHRIGIVLVANHRNFLSINGTTGATITMDAKTTTVTLPIVGGATAAVDSGAFARDSVAPTLSGVPSDTTVPAQDAAGARVDYTEPTATDDETPQPAVGCSPASGSVFGIGSTTVTCTATDADGNSASSSFAIEVKAPPAPPTPPTPLAQPAPEPVATPAAAAPPAPPRPLPPALRRLRLQSLAHGVRVRFSLTKRDTVTLTLSTGRGRELRTVRLRAGRGEHVRTLGSAGLREGRRYVVDVAGVQAPRTLRRELTFHGAPFRCPLARDSAAQLRPRVCRP